jgi:hypothetical protein
MVFTSVDNIPGESSVVARHALLERTSQLAEKLKFLLFRGALRAGESLFYCV